MRLWGPTEYDPARCGDRKAWGFNFHSFKVKQPLLCAKHCPSMEGKEQGPCPLGAAMNSEINVRVVSAPKKIRRCDGGEGDLGGVVKAGL